MSNKNGEVSWTETVYDASKGKDMFLRLNPGSNILRLATLPHQYHQHRLEIPGGKKWGYRINCSKSDTEDKCPVCESFPDNKAKRRWLIGVIERKTGTYKILDIGYAVYQSIKKLANDPDWGAPDDGRFAYDVDLFVDQNGGATGYYTVIAKPPKPLTAQDISLMEDNNPEVLKGRTEAPSYVKTKERLDNINKELGNTEGGDSSETGSSDTKEEDNNDSFFKQYKSAAS